MQPSIHPRGPNPSYLCSPANYLLLSTTADCTFFLVTLKSERRSHTFRAKTIYASSPPFIPYADYNCCYSRNQFRGHRTSSSHSGVEECLREKIKQSKSGTRMYHSSLQVVHPPKNIRVKPDVGVRACQAHTGTYVSRLAAGTDYLV